MKILCEILNRKNVQIKNALNQKVKQNIENLIAYKLFSYIYFRFMHIHSDRHYTTGIHFIFNKMIPSAFYYYFIHQ